MWCVSKVVFSRRLSQSSNRRHAGSGLEDNLQAVTRDCSVTLAQMAGHPEPQVREGSIAMRRQTGRLP